jgi:hypothetical protein
MQKNDAKNDPELIQKKRCKNRPQQPPGKPVPAASPNPVKPRKPAYIA